MLIHTNHVLQFTRALGDPVGLSKQKGSSMKKAKVSRCQLLIILTHSDTLPGTETAHQAKKSRARKSGKEERWGSGSE